MDSDFKINTSSYNYSGYGDAIDDFEDFDEIKIAEKNSGDDVYKEILKQIGIDNAFMQQILNTIIKSVNVIYKFVRINGDFSIIYFEDEFGHLTSIPLEKIISMKNLNSGLM